MAHDLRLEISDFRAIGHADIILDGITVIAGENGSGKSTISKLLYHTIKVVNEYDNIIDEQLKNRLGRISFNFRDVLRDYSYVFEDGESKYDELNKQFSIAIQLVSTDFDESQKQFINLINNAIKWITDIINSLQNSDVRTTFQSISRFFKYDKEEHIERIYKVLSSDFFPFDREDIRAPVLDETLKKYKEYINSLFVGCKEAKYNRSAVELGRKFVRQFETDIEKLDFNVFESGIAVINRDYARLSTISCVENVIYIDTPLSLGALSDSNKNEHWSDLNKSLAKESYSIDDSFANTIIHGSARLERTDLFRNKFVFKRDDDKEFNLLEVATGIKSFAILQMLLSNGSLNGNTLLILDEPEAHLHPQWIVEYGRFLVHLNKEVGVKILVASHSPDMVSALKYITEKEGKPEILNFYLAEQRESQYKYDYRHLRKEIDAIFDSYNKSYEKLDNYTD